MLFNSFSFMLIVLPSVVLLHHLACRFARPAVAQLILLIVSLGFYALAGPAQVPLLLASILFNYCIARAMSSAGPAARLWWLRAGLTGNLLFLGSLKYSRFAVSTLEWVDRHACPPAAPLASPGNQLFHHPADHVPGGLL